MLVAALIFGIAATASSGPAATCPDVLDYASWTAAPGQQWDWRGDRLTVIGAEHSRDPANEQFARIAAEFAKARPTLVLFEGPDRGVGANRDDTIRSTGESGYVRLLAKEAGLAARSLEPSPGEQMQALSKQFPFDQVLLFFVTREAARLRDREGLSGAALDEAVSGLLAKVAALGTKSGIALPFTDTAGLQAAFAQYWPGQQWQGADSRWFDPRADDGATGGQFMAAINRADSSNRNRHLVQLLKESVAKGERPFVVVGRNHVPMIAPALDCAL